MVDRRAAGFVWAIELQPNPAMPEMKIEDLLNRFALSF
jgi:hypothetical protein